MLAQEELPAQPMATLEQERQIISLSFTGQLSAGLLESCDALPTLT